MTIAVHPVTKDDAARFGILKRDLFGRITDFAEKPTENKVLRHMISRLDAQKPYLGSMGIYLFKTESLIDMLEKNPMDDFGGHIIPGAISTHKVFGYDFEGYWEDIGTIRSFYNTNLALTGANTPFNFFDPAAPIYSHPRFLPGSTVHNSCMVDTLLAEGCRIENADIYPFHHRSAQPDPQRREDQGQHPDGERLLRTGLGIRGAQDPTRDWLQLHHRMRNHR